MRGKGKAHLVEPDIDIGVMLLFLRDLGDSIDELDGLREVVKFKDPLNVLLVMVPLGELL